MRGKPYHISALYVVDLEKFRKDRVGDILRSQYQALSADPGSLANLDQDLPNYSQHYVPIFSLPQEWLWCESWCSMETKADSKTIDLCNNPLHKEPKVSMAKVRMVVETKRGILEFFHNRSYYAQFFDETFDWNMNHTENN